MDVKIVQANIDDTPEILELQKIAYQKEAVNYRNKLYRKGIKFSKYIDYKCQNVGLNGLSV